MNASVKPQDCCASADSNDIVRRFIDKADDTAKYAENAAFDAGFSKAFRQIRERNDGEALIDDSMNIIYMYGIACYKKLCRVVSESVDADM